MPLAGDPEIPLPLRSASGVLAVCVMTPPSAYCSESGGGFYLAELTLGPRGTVALGCDPATNRRLSVQPLSKMRPNHEDLTKVRGLGFRVTGGRSLSLERPPVAAYALAARLPGARSCERSFPSLQTEAAHPFRPDCVSGALSFRRRTARTLGRRTAYQGID